MKVVTLSSCGFAHAFAFSARPVRAGLEPGGPRVGAAGGFGGGGGNWLFGWVAEAEQNFFGAIFFGVQDGDGFAEGFHAKIFSAAGAIDSVHERGEVEEFCAGVHEIKVQNLLACHTHLQSDDVCTECVFWKLSLRRSGWARRSAGQAGRLSYLTQRIALGARAPDLGVRAIFQRRDGESLTGDRAREHVQCLTTPIVDRRSAPSNKKKLKVRFLGLRHEHRNELAGRGPCRGF